MVAAPVGRGHRGEGGGCPSGPAASPADDPVSRTLAYLEASHKPQNGAPAAETAGLTTIRQPIKDKGRMVGRVLLDPEFTERQVLLPTELIVRSSSGPAPRT